MDLVTTALLGSSADTASQSGSTVMAKAKAIPRTSGVVVKATTNFSVTGRGRLLGVGVVPASSDDIVTFSYMVDGVSKTLTLTGTGSNGGFTNTFAYLTFNRAFTTGLSATITSKIIVFYMLE